MLYDRHGYDQTTTQIAQQAGLARWTFFRHFADKQEVLFGGAHRLQEFLVRRVSNPSDRRQCAEHDRRPLQIIVETAPCNHEGV